MKGYQLTFFTQQDRKHDCIPLGEWLLQAAQNLGIGGATLIIATEGFGHDGKLHSTHFFELTDQPIEVTMAVTEQGAERMFAHLKQEDINVFYAKTPIEFGMTGEI
jgi:PII-like signaling protein